MWRAISVVPCSSSVQPTRNVDSTTFGSANFKDSCGISVERDSNFGTVVIGNEKELRIEITNTYTTDHSLLNATFLNSRSNFEIRNQNLPVIVPINGKIYIDVIFK